MYVTSICTINGNTYRIRRDGDRSQYTLCRNEEVIATIIRKEYDNWKGHQVKYIPRLSLSELNDFDEDDITALEDSIAYLNEYFGA